MPLTRDRRPWLLATIALLFGAAVLVAGLVYLRSDVTCGDAVMAPGDLCEGTRDGEVAETIAYEDALSDQTVGGYGLTGLGILIAVGAVAMLAFGRGKRQSLVDS